jgi:hypothetical protein
MRRRCFEHFFDLGVVLRVIIATTGSVVASSFIIHHSRSKSEIGCFFIGLFSRRIPFS